MYSGPPQTIIKAYEAGLIAREVAVEELKVCGLKSIQDGQGTPPLNQDPQAGQAGWNMQ